MEKLKEQKHKVVYAVLVVVILLLLNRGKQGRYAISSPNAQGAVFVLDTKTSQVWARSRLGNVYFVTNENPKYEEYQLPSDELKDEQKQ